MKRSTLIWSLAAVAFVTLAAACGDESPAPVAAAPVVRKTPSASSSVDAGTAVSAVPPVQYAYNPVAKRDPFRSPVDEIINKGDERTNCNEPLCQFDLDQLALVAVVTGDSNPIAMVEDPTRRGYIVRRGTKMGKQGGKVTNILRDSVVVTEYWTDASGTAKPNPVSLKLAADKAVSADMDLLRGKPYSP